MEQTYTLTCSRMAEETGWVDGGLDSNTSACFGLMPLTKSCVLEAVFCLRDSFLGCNLEDTFLGANSTE